MTKGRGGHNITARQRLSIPILASREWHFCGADALWLWEQGSEGSSEASQEGPGPVLKNTRTHATCFKGMVWRAYVETLVLGCLDIVFSCRYI
jgi:hypothetical protein